MIVPMKKVSLIMLSDKKTDALKKLRKLGLLHIKITEGNGTRLAELKKQMSLLENGLFIISEYAKKGSGTNIVTDLNALAIAEETILLTENKKQYQAEISELTAELERLKCWGEIDPDEIIGLSQKGIDISFYELPKDLYDSLGDDIQSLCLERTKNSVRCLLVKTANNDAFDRLTDYELKLPDISTNEIRQKIDKLNETITSIDEKITSFAGCTDSIKNAIYTTNKEIEFEIYSTGMEQENLSEDNGISVAHFTGYIEAENLDRLKAAAKENAWGLLSEEPCEEDDVPTKLKNNRFVSLIYPLTDFLGTVPGYFEYDISGWFLAFILIFFGIIFGDGGYGLLITAVAAIPIIKSLISKKTVQPTFLLIALFGLSTVLWGTLTCTWFGLSPEQLPEWLKSLSIPILSNVYADKIWYPFWTNGNAGLTTAQNLQILCFTFALVQLTVAHIKCAIRNRKSLKVIGDIGSAIELVGMFYLVLSFVVNGEVFSFSLVIGGIPVGSIAIAFVAIGFVLSFIFANYEGSVIKSILSSLANIVSVLLGIFNLFSDIVSYIRLWAVGLAGAAISATVNELAGPLLGNFMFMILAIILLVFGHGLNMILNILSVIVHGIRLNTLEFSSHLGMSWSGYRFKPFEEKNNY